MNKSSTLNLIRRGFLAGGFLASSATLVLAQDTPTLADLIQENKALTARIEALEQKQAAMATPATSSVPVSKPASPFDKFTISGFAQASYFSDLNNEHSQRIPTYLWNNKNNNFSINKVKLTFASTPAVRSDTDWSAAFRVSLMAGEDSPVLNSSAGTLGFDYLREAYVEANVPIGTGLIVRAGELISLLNWESGDGGAANPNFSQGYQWWYTGNGPSAGVQADYSFTDWVGVTARVDNGLYAGPVGNSNKKAGMVSINLKPTKDLWFNIIGFGGLGGGTLDANGGSIIGGYQLTPKLGTGIEADYFSFHNQGKASGALPSIGGWIWYDFTPQYGVAFRAEYLDDQNGVGINGGPNPFGAGSGLVSASPSGGLESFTLTFNWHPVPALKIQPEFRVNHTSYSGGFAGKQYEYVLGMGATYSY
jgi:hypothetical protein